MSIRIEQCSTRKQPVVIIPLHSEMARRRKRGGSHTSHVAVVGFRDEAEARAWHPEMKAPHLEIVGLTISQENAACDIGCCR